MLLLMTTKGVINHYIHYLVRFIKTAARLLKVASKRFHKIIIRICYKMQLKIWL